MMSTRTSRTKLLTIVVALACTALAPATAHAGAGLAVTPTFPTSSRVGDTDLAASLTLSNANTGADVSATICNSTDLGPCPMLGEGITLIPSCGGQGADSGCVVADPGVFVLSQLATGAAGSACAGMGFVISPNGGSFGKVHFVPFDGAHVVLPTPGLSCRIDFTVSVFKVPDSDAQPGAEGIQTIPITDASMRSNLGTTSFARGSQRGVTVPAPPPPPSTPPSPPAETPPPLPPPLPPPPAATPAPTEGGLVPPRAPSGTAVLIARTGCRALPFRVQVRGTSIRKVVFRLDGKTVKTLNGPNRGKRYSLRIYPRRLKPGKHRVAAAVSFTAASDTSAKTLRTSFRRCR